MRRKNIPDLIDKVTDVADILLKMTRKGSKETALKIKKSQYKLQMLVPKATSGAIGCWPLGFADMLYSSFKEYPYDGQDWSYLVWRKRNCCVW